MKFGISQFFQQTPSKFVQIGNFLIVIASSATAYLHFQPDSVTGQVIQIIGLFGSLFVNLFGEKSQ